MHNGRWLAVGFTILLTAGVLGPDVELTEGADLDPSVVAVLPFQHQGGASPVLLSGDECQFFLTTALSRWYGVKLVDELRLNDAVARRGSEPLSARAESEVAREVGAGRTITGEFWQSGDSVYVKATLRSALRPAVALKERTIALSTDLENVARKFSELADAILLGRDSLAPDLKDASFGTNSIDAWRDYTAGRKALAEWDLAQAQRAFRSAVQSDPDFPQASLMLVQSLLFAGDTAGQFREAAARASALRQQLPAQDRLVAEAAQAIADGRYPHACRLYWSLLRADSLDFRGWYGLGLCQLGDPVVERDARSPSGWRFRGSARAGVEAFRRAFTILPSSHLAFRGPALTRLSRVFYTEPGAIRIGYGPSPRDTARFGARPSLFADTLAFVPVPIADIAFGRNGALPASNAAALAWGRRQMLELAERWVAAFPESPDALEAEAAALEAIERSASPVPNGKSSLASVKQGRALARSPEQRLRLASKQIALLIKGQDFVGGASLADSVLAAWKTPSPAEAASMVWIAEVTGRAEQAAALASRAAPTYRPAASDGSAPALPLAPRQEGLRLLAYAALGVSPDSVRAQMARVEQAIRTWVQRPVREAARSALLDVPAMVAYADLGATSAQRPSAQGFFMLELQFAATHGDFATVRRWIDDADTRFWGDTRVPGTRTLDATLGIARLRLQVGDTARAVRELDPLLGALATIQSGPFGSWLQTAIPQSASLPRIFVLRADLAALAGDRATARRWAQAVTDLWYDADPGLRPVVQRMRALAAGAAR